jgi:hypothetical protein
VCGKVRQEPGCSIYANMVIEVPADDGSSTPNKKRRYQKTRKGQMSETHRHVATADQELADLATWDK